MGEVGGALWVEEAGWERLGGGHYGLRRLGGRGGGGTKG